MGYVEERIKYLAVQEWQRDIRKHELTCGNSNCEGKEWGGTMVARMDDPGPNGTGPFALIECHDCGREQTFVPNPVIDAFLAHI